MDQKQFIEEVNASVETMKGLVEDAKKNSLSADEKANVFAEIEKLNKGINDLSVKMERNIELPKEEQKKYSYFNLMKAALNNGKFDKDCLEKEYHVQTLKSMNIDTSANGGLLAPELEAPGIEMQPVASTPIIDRVRKINILNGGSFSFAIEGDASTFSWTGSEEAGSESQPTLSQKTLTPKYYRTYAYISREAMKQVRADANLEAFVRDSLIKGQRKGLERVLLRGTSTNGQPKGILEHSNILTVTGGVPTLDTIDNMIAALEAVDTLEGNLAVLTHPAIAKILRQSKDSNNQYYIQKKNNAGISEHIGLPFVTSTNMYASGSNYPIVLADWSKVILATFGALEVKVNEQAFTPWSKNQVVVGLFGTADVGIINENSVCAISDATLS